MKAIIATVGLSLLLLGMYSVRWVGASSLPTNTFVVTSTSDNNCSPDGSTGVVKIGLKVDSARGKAGIKVIQPRLP